MEKEVFDNLDIKPEDFRKLGYRVIDMITEYYASIQEVPVYPAATSSEVEQIFKEDFPVKGQDPFDIVDEWKSKILPYATHLGSPRYFGFVNGSGTMIGTLAEALAAAVNMNPGGWKPAPSATEVERRTIAWMAEMVGYPGDCGGLFTTGGTMANFTAIETALRNIAPYDITAKGLQDKQMPGRFKVYMSDHEGHISIIRVVDLLNLGRESIHLVKSREDFSMDTNDLGRCIDEDITNGDFPLCVVAQVGSINVGVIDPLEEIAAICKKRNIWFHADGACGAVGTLLPEKRDQYKGLELADSITLDPHKWLYIPYDCGCVLIRDAEKMRRAFSIQAPYLRGTLPTEYTGLYYLDYGPEMSRGFRALKVWMSIKQFGAEGYRKLLSQNVKCVEYLDSLVRKDKDFEALHKPNLFIYCMRYAPQKIKDKYEQDSIELNKYLDELNQKIADEIQLSGTAFIMTSKVRGKTVIRLSVCSHRTTKEDIEIVFLKLKEIGESLTDRSEN
ncbi:MAG: aspartate aminotransferase family protein [Ignavibacteria bacterium]|nr:aspartate aminotransferase family protein [Ignavibacteria bacterium]